MNCDRSKALLPVYPVLNTETDCPVDRALQIIDTARQNSCGKDVLCREGLLQVYTILRDVASGRGRDEDIPLLSELLDVIRPNVGCEMSAEAVAACQSLFKEYEEIFQRHIMRRLCPALVCARLYTMHVSPEDCDACGACVAVCLDNAIMGGDGMIHVIDNQKCTRCLKCIPACSHGAIMKAGAVKPKGPEEPVALGSFEGTSGERRRRRRGVIPEGERNDESV